MTDPRLMALAERACATLACRRDAPAEGPTLTVVLRGNVRGAVHVFVEADAHAVERAAELAQALVFEAGGAGFTCAAQWHGRTLGPHTGERFGALVLDLELVAAERPISISQTLSAAQKLSEASVLTIGQEMRGIWQLARDQADALSSIANQFGATDVEGSDAHSVASTIDKLSEQMRSFGEEVVERTNRQAADIEQARSWTNNIVKLGSAIAAIATNARLLTFNARLESARIGEAGRGFAVIATSIQELATQVRQTNNSVSQLAQNLATALPRLNADALANARATQAQVAQIETHLLAVHDRVAAMRGASFRAISESSTTASKLQETADEVLTHLQFQDRTSQMLDDVRQQAATVLAVAGLAEQEVPTKDLAQVGALGRALSQSVEEAQAEGAVLLF